MPTRLPKTKKSEPPKRGKLPPARKLTVERVEAALRACHGIKQLTADAIGCTRQNLWKFMEANPHLKDIVKEIEESTLDLAENNIVTDIVTGKNVKTSMWYAERKGKDRGYSTRVETTGANGEPIRHTEIRRTIVDPAPGDRPKEVYNGNEEDDEDGG